MPGAPWRPGRASAVPRSGSAGGPAAPCRRTRASAVTEPSGVSPVVPVSSVGEWIMAAAGRSRSCRGRRGIAAQWASIRPWRPGRVCRCRSWDSCRSARRLSLWEVQTLPGRSVLRTSRARRDGGRRRPSRSWGPVGRVRAVVGLCSRRRAVSRAVRPDRAQRGRDPGVCRGRSSRGRALRATALHHSPARSDPQDGHRACRHPPRGRP